MTIPKTARLPDEEALRRCFDYDERIGLLIWKERRSIGRKIEWWNNVFAGKPAGALQSHGYIRISLNVAGRTRRYYAHRIIFKMMTGRDPVAEIDHRDGNRSNNVWSNLREASRGENSRNQSAPSTNKTGTKGVSWCPRRNNWRVALCAGGKQINVGRFLSLDEAVRAQIDARERLHGQFARHR